MVTEMVVLVGAVAQQQIQDSHKQMESLAAEVAVVKLMGIAVDVAVDFLEKLELEGIPADIPSTAVVEEAVVDKLGNCFPAEAHWYRLFVDVVAAAVEYMVVAVVVAGFAVDTCHNFGVEVPSNPGL